VKSKGIACVYQPLAEGYRAWAAGFALSKGIKTTAKADLAFEFINWFLDGGGPPGAVPLSARPCPVGILAA
jgi:putative spermidine/putrescine transport system substrate-binding protein